MDTEACFPLSLMRIWDKKARKYCRSSPGYTRSLMSLSEILRQVGLFFLWPNNGVFLVDQRILLKEKVDEVPDLWSVLRSYLLTQALICWCEDGSSMFFGDPRFHEYGGDVICVLVMRIDAATAPLFSRMLATRHDEHRQRRWIFVGGEPLVV